MEYWCLLCDAKADAEVDVSVGIPGGLCRVHLERWIEQRARVSSDTARQTGPGERPQSLRQGG